MSKCADPFWAGRIEAASLFDLMALERFAPIGHPVFRFGEEPGVGNPLHDLFRNRYKALREEVTAAEAGALSKAVGWDSKHWDQSRWER